MLKFHLRALLACFLIGGASFPLSSSADPAKAKRIPKATVVEDLSEAIVFEKSSPWFFSFGATTRSIDTGFSLNGRQTSLNWRRYTNQQSGRGNVGLYRDGGNTVRYDDGFVGPHNLTGLGLQPGLAGGYVNSAGQISSMPSPTPFFIANTISFNTDTFSYRSTMDQSTSNVTNSDLGIGPYLQMGYHLTTIDHFIVNLVTGWSFIRTKHGSGNQNVANLTVTENRTTYTYQYDHLSLNPALFPPGTLGPLPGPITGFSFLVINSDLAATIPGFQAPRQTTRNSDRTAARFYAISSADLDVNLNETPFWFRNRQTSRTSGHLPYRRSDPQRHRLRPFQLRHLVPDGSLPPSHPTALA